MLCNLHLNSISQLIKLLILNLFGLISHNLIDFPLDIIYIILLVFDLLHQALDRFEGPLLIGIFYAAPEFFYALIVEIVPGGILLLDFFFDLVGRCL